jgi:hypothetical protein
MELNKVIFRLKLVLTKTNKAPEEDILEKVTKAKKHQIKSNK